jgi:hypothetical protein
MIGDHHGRTAGGATVLVRAVDGIVGTHRRIETRGMQDLPYRRQRYGEIELRQLAVYPAVSHSGSPSPAGRQGDDAPGCRRTTGLRARSSA